MTGEPKKSAIPCPECGSENCVWERRPRDYLTVWECPDCGEDGCEHDEDLYGCMSVPWGYLL